MVWSARGGALTPPRGACMEASEPPAQFLSIKTTELLRGAMQKRFESSVAVRLVPGLPRLGACSMRRRSHTPYAPAVCAYRGGGRGSSCQPARPPEPLRASPAKCMKSARKPMSCFAIDAQPAAVLHLPWSAPEVETSSQLKVATRRSSMHSKYSARGCTDAAGWGRPRRSR